MKLSRMPVSQSTKYVRGGFMLVATLSIVAVIGSIVAPKHEIWSFFDRMNPWHHGTADAADSTLHDSATAKSLHPAETVRVAAVRTIEIQPGAGLERRLSVVNVTRIHGQVARLTVSGSIVARMRPGPVAEPDGWQFDRTALADVYAEWIRVRSEIEFATALLNKTKELTEAQTAYLKGTLDRLMSLSQTGSVPDKNLRQSQAELLEMQLKGEKEIFSAQSTLRQATNARTALERQLSQAGIEPVVFERAVPNMVLIVASIPESKIAEVEEGQACEAHFYSFPDEAFPAHVELLGSTLSPERRVLRVLFDLNDPKGVLRPGMYADVLLGTEHRDLLLVPAEALLHLNQDDYVLAADGPGRWRVTEVELGEYRDGFFEVLHGLTEGQQVIGSGSVLLKAVAARSLIQPVAAAQPATEVQSDAKVHRANEAEPASGVQP